MQDNFVFACLLHLHSKRKAIDFYAFKLKRKKLIESVVELWVKKQFYFNSGHFVFSLKNGTYIVYEILLTYIALVAKLPLLRAKLQQITHFQLKTLLFIRKAIKIISKHFKNDWKTMLISKFS